MVQQDYKSMIQELQGLLLDMQAEDLDVDEAITKYERGQKLIGELQKYLETAENKITKQQPVKGRGAKQA